MLLSLSVLGMVVAASPYLVPKPRSMAVGNGVFSLTSETAIVANGPAGRVARYLQSALRPATGYDLPIRGRATGNRIEIRVRDDAEVRGDEGYRLVSDSGGIRIDAKTDHGAFNGVQTLRQLLPSAIFSPRWQTNVRWTVPVVTIDDSPRFTWRGGHLDVGRHFMPVETVKRFIDLLAMHKMNVFHWHLTEDQGWRIEIKKYPKLTQIGSKRRDTMLKYDPKTYSGKPHEGFYTQAQVRDIVKYASDRFVTIVPEIEMPGHAAAAIAAYPELGNTGKPIEVKVDWGVHEDVFNAEDSTISFLKDVLTEVMALFPGKFIHIGGDECPKQQWKASPKAQEKIKALGLKDEHELQSWFIRQMDQFLAAKGRRLIGWSEILEGGLAPGAALMVWLGDEGALQAASSGHDVVMAQTSHTYFDYYQSQDRAREPHAIGGFVPLEKVYSYEPILPAMTAEQARHVMGAQFQIWTEYIPDGSRVEYMAYPRGCALAEVVWSPKDQRNVEDFLARLPFHLDRLAAMGVNFRRLDAGIGGRDH
ncbi:MAG: Beta-hexosaminidase [Fimbriimonadaceae bacterium]|nr:Beta-hexosaminidase [Fimbriimonadaceae bacterium]